MVQKNAVIGAAVMVSVSAPTAMAVCMAEAAGFTLHAHKSVRGREQATQQLRNANDSLILPSVEQQDLSDYSEGHVISVPAGR